MSKDKQIEYLNAIKPYINLKQICEDYNRFSSIQIDYNNLRAVLNGISKTRLSEDKLNSFIQYLFQHLYPNVFQVYESTNIISSSTIADIVTNCAAKMSEEIIKELKNEFPNNRR